jgi:signal transduction histidine kinase
MTPRQGTAPRRRAALRLWSQLVLGTVGIVCATSAAFALLLSLFFGHYFAAARLSVLSARARTVAALWRLPPRRAAPQIAALVRDTGGLCWVLGSSGETLAEFGPARLAAAAGPAAQAEEAELLGGRPVHLVVTESSAHERLAVVGVPVSGANGAAAVLWVAPVRGQDVLRAVAARLAVVAGAGLLLAAALSAWFAAHVVRPIRRLEVTAGQIAAGQFAVDVAEGGPAEVRSLARSLEHMASRLAALDRERRAFLADVSHELRTPLAAVRGALEGLRSGQAATFAPDLRYLETALHEARRMDRLIDDLLALARADAGRLELHRRPVDVAEEVARVALSLEPVASSRRVSFHFDLPEVPVPVDADPDRLSQVLWNLLDNAARHTPGGGRVTVALTSSAGCAVLRLQNPGPPWSPAETARLFERFERRDTEGGAGLGLAIARTLTRAHGGDLEAQPLPEGGLAVTLRWPLAAAGAPGTGAVAPPAGGSGTGPPGPGGHAAPDRRSGPR